MKIKSLILPNLGLKQTIVKESKENLKTLIEDKNNHDIIQVNSSLMTKFKTLETNSIKTVNYEYLETNDNTSSVRETKDKKTKKNLVTTNLTDSKIISRNAVNKVKNIFNDNCLFNIDSFSTEADKLRTQKKNSLLKSNQIEIDKNLLIKSIKSYKKNNGLKISKFGENIKENDQNMLKHIDINVKNAKSNNSLLKNISKIEIHEFFFKNSIKNLSNKRNEIKSSLNKLKKGIKNINSNIQNIVNSYEANKEEKSISVNSSSNDSYLQEEIKDIVELEDIDIIKKRMEMKKKVMNMYQSIEKISNLENYSREYYKVPDLKNNLSLFNDNTYQKTKQKLELISKNVTKFKPQKTEDSDNKKENSSKELEYNLLGSNNNGNVLDNNLAILSKYMETNLKDTEELKNYYSYFKYKTEFYENVKFANDKEKEIINSI